MGRRIIGVVFGLLFGHAAFSQAFDLVGLPSRVVPVTGTRMTNLVFPVSLETGVKVSRDVLVQRPKGVENVIELKAVRRNFPPTNLSVFGKDGRLYTFDLRYVEDTSVLSFQVVATSSPGVVRLSGLPVDVATLEADAKLLAGCRSFLRARTRSGGIRLGLSGIYLRDGLMWLCFRVRNGTQIGFSPAYVRVFTEDRKRVKRTASQDIDLAPVYAGKVGVVPGRRAVVFAEAFMPFTVARGKRLVVELADDGGGRSLELVVKGKEVLRARE